MMESPPALPPESPLRPAPDQKGSWLLRFISLPWGGMTLLCMGANISMSSFGQLYALSTGDRSPLLTEDSPVVAGYLLGVMGIFLMWLVKSGYRASGRQLRPLRSARRWGLAGGVSLGIGMGLSMLTLLIPALHTARQAGEAAERHRRMMNSQWDIHPFAQGRWAVSVPAGCEIPPGVEPQEGVLLLVSPDQEFFMEASAVRQAEITPSTLEEVAALSLDQLRQDGKETFPDGDSRRETIGGYPALVTPLIIRSDGTDVPVELNLLKTGQEWVELRFWSASTPQHQANESLRNRIKQSLSAHR